MEFGLNEAAVQFIAAKIIGIQPDFEKYFDINVYTPSPSYYPMECALLNELIFFVGEDVLFKSTYFSTDDFKNEIINITSKNVFDKILYAFDNILKYEEQIIILNNKILSADKSYKLQNKLLNYRKKIKYIFIETQNLILKEFFEGLFKNITNLEELETFRRKLNKFEQLVATYDDYSFFDNFYAEMMNKLEHKSNVLENGGVETAVLAKSFSLSNLMRKFKDLIFSKNI